MDVSEKLALPGYGEKQKLTLMTETVYILLKLKHGCVAGVVKCVDQKKEGSLKMSLIIWNNYCYRKFIPSCKGCTWSTWKDQRGYEGSEIRGV